jgi:hypothetical protein
MPIPPSILERVETFRRNLDSYLAPDYKETELRREFLDPLFDALGWDVFNRAGHTEAYKDVVHEDTLKISGETKAPDYSFRIGGTRKFFVEAKKPSVRIKDDPEPAKQLRRYSYSAKLGLGIVTDFHEFAIYDGRTRPKETDKADIASFITTGPPNFAANARSDSPRPVRARRRRPGCRAGSPASARRLLSFLGRAIHLRPRTGLAQPRVDRPRPVHRHRARPRLFPCCRWPDHLHQSAAPPLLLGAPGFPMDPAGPTAEP